jgi:hypothetical protein
MTNLETIAGYFATASAVTKPVYRHCGTGGEVDRRYANPTTMTNTISPATFNALIQGVLHPADRSAITIFRIFGIADVVEGTNGTPARDSGKYYTAQVASSYVAWAGPTDRIHDGATIAVRNGRQCRVLFVR